MNARPTAITWKTQHKQILACSSFGVLHKQVQRLLSCASASSSSDKEQTACTENQWRKTSQLTFPPQNNPIQQLMQMQLNNVRILFLTSYALGKQDANNLTCTFTPGCTQETSGAFSVTPPHERTQSTVMVSDHVLASQRLAKHVHDLFIGKRTHLLLIGLNNRHIYTKYIYRGGARGYAGKTASSKTSFTHVLHQANAVTTIVWVLRGSSQY